MKRAALSALTMLALATAPAAFATDYSAFNKPVTDKRGNIVTTTTGGCLVHLRWEGGKAGECATAEAKTTDTVVYFAFNSSKLGTGSKAELDRFVASLAGKEIVSANVIGYADKIGNAEYNRLLSEKRALRVAKYLQKKGLVAASVAEVRALGESEPTTDCGKKASRACLAPDRRVEVKVTVAK
jgi:outer membrane protein OmpA-like peptidoglycan-associated protein